MPEGIARRYSTGTVVSKFPVFLSSSKEKIRPRYLRASTGSCHDFCKYGRKHEYGDKEKYDPRSSEDKEVNHKKEGSARAVNVERRKKKSSKQRGTNRTRLKSSDGADSHESKSCTETGFIVSVKKHGNKVRNSQTFFSNNKSTVSCGIAERNDSHCVEEVKSVANVQIQDGCFPPFQQNEPSENVWDHHLSEAPEGTNTLHESDVLRQCGIAKAEPPFGRMVQPGNEVVPQRPHETVNQLPTFMSPPIKDVLADQLVTVKPEMMSVCESLPTKDSTTVKKNASSVKSIVPSAKPKRRKESSPVSKQAFSSVKHKDNMEKTAGKASSKFVAGVKSAAAEAKGTPQIASASPSNVPGIITRKATGKCNFTKKGIPARAEVTKVTHLPMLSSHKHPTESGSSLKSRSRRDTNSFSLTKNPKKIVKAKGSDGDVNEKMLSVFDPKEETVNSSPVRMMSNTDRRSPPMPSSSVSLSDDGEEGIIYNSGTRHNEQDDDGWVKTLNGGGGKKILNRAARSHPREKDVEAHGLEYRRGKVVNHQPSSEGPKKLRFRNGRELEWKRESKDGRGRKAHKKRSRKKDVIDHRLNHDAPTEIVVLRHQEQDKKDAQGLLNEVIEVTVSKLVETRKSKVKALVGAFETVISLQERKPASDSLWQ